jgi:hypothetical protein
MPYKIYLSIYTTATGGNSVTKNYATARHLVSISEINEEGQHVVAGQKP